MRIIGILLAACVVAVLTACEQVPADLSLYNAVVVSDASITNSEGKELGRTEKGGEESVVCNWDDVSAVVLSGRVEGDRWTNSGEAAVGFVPADALAPPGGTPPSCDGFLHGPDEHKEHLAPTS